MENDVIHRVVAPTRNLGGRLGVAGPDRDHPQWVVGHVGAPAAETP
jgi:hypothetical protein